MTHRLLRARLGGAAAVVASSAFLTVSLPAHADGQATYESSCQVCHAAGVAGAPKLGDKEAWAARIEQGVDVLVGHAINGFQGQAGYMPPKGGNMSLSDDDVKAAVEYMLQSVQ